jgi:hypothetical protein
VSSLIDRYKDIIESVAETQNIDPDLIYSVINQESGGKHDAVSPVGAGGLMQLMPDTARGLGLRVDPNKGIDDRFDPIKNIKAGAKYLKQLNNMYGGDIDLTLAAYNAGPGNVAKAGNKIPNFAETQNYVKKVRGFYDQRKGISIPDQEIAFDDSLEDDNRNIIDKVIFPQARAEPPVNVFEYKPIKSQPKQTKKITTSNPFEFKPKPLPGDMEDISKASMPLNSAGGMVRDTLQPTSEDASETLPFFETTGNVAEKSGGAVKVIGDIVGRTVGGTVAGAIDAAVNTPGHYANLAVPVVNKYSKDVNDIFDFVTNQETEPFKLNAVQPVGLEEIPFIGESLQQAEDIDPFGGAIGQVGTELVKGNVAFNAVRALNRGKQALSLAAIFGLEDVGAQVPEIEARTGEAVDLELLGEELNKAEVAITAAGGAAYPLITATGGAIKDVLKNAKNVPGVTGTLKNMFRSFFGKLNEVPELPIDLKAAAMRAEKELQAEGLKSGTVGKAREVLHGKITKRINIENEKLSNSVYQKKFFNKEFTNEESTYLKGSFQRLVESVKKGRIDLTDDAVKDIEKGLNDVGVQGSYIKPYIENLYKESAKITDAQKIIDTSDLFLAQDSSSRLFSVLNANEKAFAGGGREYLPYSAGDELLSTVKKTAASTDKVFKKITHPDFEKNTILEQVKQLSLKADDVLEGQLTPERKQTVSIIKEQLSAFADKMSEKGLKLSTGRAKALQELLDDVDVRWKSLLGDSQPASMFEVPELNPKFQALFDEIDDVGRDLTTAREFAEYSSNPTSTVSIAQKTKQATQLLYDNVKRKIKLNPKELSNAYKQNLEHPADTLRGLKNAGVKQADDLLAAIEGKVGSYEAEMIELRRPLEIDIEKLGMQEGSTMDRAMKKLDRLVFTDDMTDPKKFAYWSASPQRFISRWKSEVPELDKVNFTQGHLDLFKKGKDSFYELRKRDGLGIKEALDPYSPEQVLGANAGLNKKTIKRLGKFYNDPDGFVTETKKYYLEHRVLGGAKSYNESYIATLLGRVEQSVNNRTTDQLLEYVARGLENNAFPESMQPSIYSIAYQLAGKEQLGKTLGEAAKIIGKGGSNFTKGVLSTPSFAALNLTQLGFPMSDLLTDRAATRAFGKILANPIQSEQFLAVMQKNGLFKGSADDFAALIGPDAPRDVLTQKTADWLEQKGMQGAAKTFGRFTSSPFIGSTEDFLKGTTALAALAKKFPNNLPEAIAALNNPKANPELFRKATQAIYGDIGKYLFVRSGFSSLIGSKPIIGGFTRFNTTSMRSIALAMDHLNTNPNAFGNLIGFYTATGGSQAVLPFVNSINWLSRTLTGKDAVSGAEYQIADERAEAGMLPGPIGAIAQAHRFLGQGTASRQSPDIVSVAPIETAFFKLKADFESRRVSVLDALFSLRTFMSSKFIVSPNLEKAFVKWILGDPLAKGDEKKHPGSKINKILISSSAGNSREFRIDSWTDAFQQALKVGKKPLKLKRYVDQLDTINTSAKDYYKEVANERIIKSNMSLASDIKRQLIDESIEKQNQLSRRLDSEIINLEDGFGAGETPVAPLKVIKLTAKDEEASAKKQAFIDAAAYSSQRLTTVVDSLRQKGINENEKIKLRQERVQLSRTLNILNKEKTKENAIERAYDKSRVKI